LVNSQYIRGVKRGMIVGNVEDCISDGAVRIGGMWGSLHAAREGRVSIGAPWMIVGMLAAARRLGYVGMAAVLTGKQRRD